MLSAFREGADLLEAFLRKMQERFVGFGVVGLQKKCAQCRPQIACVTRRKGLLDLLPQQRIPPSLKSVLQRHEFALRQRLCFNPLPGVKRRHKQDQRGGPSEGGCRLGRARFLGVRILRRPVLACGEMLGNDVLQLRAERVGKQRLMQKTEGRFGVHKGRDELPRVNRRSALAESRTMMRRRA